MGQRRKRHDRHVLRALMRLDWKVSALLAWVCIFAGGVLIPAVFDDGAAQPALGFAFALAVWLLAAVFGSVAVLRCITPPQTADSFIGAPTHVMTDPPTGAAAPVPQGAAVERVIVPGRFPQRSAASSSPDESPRIELPQPATPPRPARWSLDVLRDMEWKRFEDLCCAFYREKGIRAVTTPLGADGGIDIHLFQDASEPYRATAIVQCKVWSGEIGVKPIRELRVVMVQEDVDKAFFMAPNGFTDEARAFASDNHITLVDGRLFLAMLQRLPDESAAHLLDFATEGQWTTPSCPNCGIKMALRDDGRGPFWGCRLHPKCDGRMEMREPPGRDGCPDRDAA